MYTRIASIALCGILCCANIGNAQVLDDDDGDRRTWLLQRMQQEARELETRLQTNRRIVLKSNGRLYSTEVAMEQAKRCAQTDNILDEFIGDVTLGSDSRNGFRRYERTPPLDAWQVPVHITYGNHWLHETVIIQSAGPDMEHGTDDDMRRERSTVDVLGFSPPIWAAMLSLWLGSIVLIFPLSRRVCALRAELGNQGGVHAFTADNHRRLLNLEPPAMVGTSVIAPLYACILLGLLIGLLIYKHDEAQ